MRFRILGLAAAASLVSQAAFGAAAPIPAASTTEATFVTQADIAAMIARAPALGTPGQANISQTILRVPPYNLNLEFRPIGGGPAVHPGDSELFMVVQGAGAMTSGGRIVRPANGLAVIEGGSTRRVAKGDLFLIPMGMPHAFTDSDGSLAVMAIHLFPQPPASPPAAP